MAWEYRNTVLSLCMLAFFGTFFSRLVFSPIIPLITKDFEITNALIGFGLSGMWLAYGLSQYPSGLLADRYGEKSIILLALGGTVVTSLLISIAPIFPIFVISIVFLGGFAGLHYSVGTTLLSRMFDDMGRAISIHSLGSPLAGLIAPATAAWVGVRFGWRWAVLLSVVISFPIFLLFIRFVEPTEPRRPDEVIRDQISIAPVQQLLLRPPIVFTLIIGISATYVLNGLITFLPTFLVDYRGQTPTMAGILFSIFFVARGAVQIGIGSVSDEYGRDLALGICMISSAIGVALFVIGPGLFAVFLGIIFAGISASYFPALDPRFLDRISETNAGTEFGLVRTIYVVIGSAGPIGVGFFADIFGWAVSFMTLVAISLILFCGLAVNWILNLGY